MNRTQCLPVSATLPPLANHRVPYEASTNKLLPFSGILRKFSPNGFIFIFFIYLFTNLQNWRDIHNRTWIKHDKTSIRHQHCYVSGDIIIFSKILIPLVKSAVIRYLTLSNTIALYSRFNFSFHICIFRIAYKAHISAMS